MLLQCQQARGRRHGCPLLGFLKMVLLINGRIQTTETTIKYLISWVTSFDTHTVNANAPRIGEFRNNCYVNWCQCDIPLLANSSHYSAISTISVSVTRTWQQRFLNDLVWEANVSVAAAEVLSVKATVAAKHLELLKNRQEIATAEKVEVFNCFSIVIGGVWFE